MSIRIRPANGARLERLQVLEHTLTFGSDGYANGNELTKDEVKRLRRFHFVIEQIPDAKPEVPAVDETDVQDATEATDNEQKTRGRKRKVTEVAESI